jgi:hypothetical protein
LRRLSGSSQWAPTSKEFLKRLASSIDAAPSALAGGLFRETVATAAIFSKTLAHVVDHFLRDELTATRKAFAVNSSDVDAKVIAEIRHVLREFYNPDHIFVRYLSEIEFQNI